AGTRWNSMNGSQLCGRHFTVRNKLQVRDNGHGSRRSLPRALTEYAMPLVRSFAVLSTLSVIVAAGIGATTRAQGGKTVDAATAGMVTGRAVFEGTPPPAEALKGVNDPACQKAMGDSPVNDTVVIGANGALKNVFVYVKSGLDPAYSFAVPSTPVQLDQ